MKTILALMTTVIVLASGCAPKQSAPSGGMKVALLVAGPVSDKGWNGLAHDAVAELAKNSGVAVTELQTRSKGDIESALRDFAARDYPLVIGHGNEYGDLAVQVGREFPKTRFVITAGRVDGPNVTSLVIKIEDGSYLCGMLAAGMTKTGKAACIGGMQLPVIESTFHGFQTGAQTGKTKMPVIFTYLNSWDDTGAGKQQTATLISQGFDCIFPNADAANIGVFQAVQEAKRDGKTVYAFGSNADQSSLAPDVIVASSVLNIEPTLEKIVAEIKANKFEGKQRLLDMKSGAISLVINPALKGKIPPDLLKQVKDAEKRIKSGDLVVPQSA